MEALRRDFLSALYAVAEFSVTEALERRFNAAAFSGAAAGLSLRHGVHLHRIHPAEPADALLVEHNRRAVGRRFLFGDNQFLDTRLKALAERILRFPVHLW